MTTILLSLPFDACTRARRFRKHACQPESDSSRPNWTKQCSQRPSTRFPWTPLARSWYPMLPWASVTYADALHHQDHSIMRRSTQYNPHDTRDQYHGVLTRTLAASIQLEGIQNTPVSPPVFRYHSHQRRCYCFRNPSIIRYAYLRSAQLDLLSTG